MSYQITRKIRDAVIVNFREAFKTDSVYTYKEVVDGNTDLATTQITITDVTPNEVSVIPALVVSTLPVDEKRFLQQDLFTEEKNINGTYKTTRGSMLFAEVNLDLWTLDGINRDQVLDRVYHHLKTFTDKLTESGIELIQTTILTDRRSFLLDRWWYTGGIKLRVYSEYYEEETDESVSGIKVSIPLAQP